MSLYYVILNSIGASGQAYGLAAMGRMLGSSMGVRHLLRAGSARFHLSESLRVLRSG